MVNGIRMANALALMGLAASGLSADYPPVVIRADRDREARRKPERKPDPEVVAARREAAAKRRDRDAAYAETARQQAADKRARKNARRATAAATDTAEPVTGAGEARAA